MSNKKALFFILLILVSIISIWVLYTVLSLPLEVEGTVDVLDSKYYIAHAGGGIDGHTYTNSKEALLQSLDRGYKFIELDFSMTSDGHLVCAHGASVFNEKTDGNKDSISIMPDLNTFKQRKIHGSYTPITANEVLVFLEGSNFTLITDYLSDPLIIDKYFSEVKNRIIVETPSISNYKSLIQMGYNPMLTLGNVTLRNMMKFLLCRIMTGTSIKYVTVTVNSHKKNLRVLKRLFGVNVFAYTCNSEEFLYDYIEKEVDKVYTDFLY